VLWIGSAGLLVFCVTVLIRPGPIDAFPRYSNPAGVDLPGRGALFGLSFVVFAVALAFAAVPLVVRFRQARGIEQQQLKLLMSAGVVAVALFVTGAALESLFGSDRLQAATVIGVFVIPAAIGVAMLRYRLYEIDRVISRALVYTTLTLVLGAAYAGSCSRGRRCSRRSPAAAISRLRCPRWWLRHCSYRSARGCSGS
jgi:hypothetical protein